MERSPEEERAALAAAQNLAPGAVPEQRPIASQQVEANTGIIAQRLQEAGDPRVVEEPMDQEAYDRANSDEQRDAAAEASRTPELHVGQHAIIENEGEPDHGRAVAIVRVIEYESLEDERIAAAGNPESRFAKVKTFECRSRDGRHELLAVSAEHLRRVDPQDYTKNPA